MGGCGIGRFDLRSPVISSQWMDVRTSLCVPLAVRQRDALSLAAAVFCDPPTSPLCFVWGGASPAESCVRRAPLCFLLLPTIISFPSYQRTWVALRRQQGQMHARPGEKMNARWAWTMRTSLQDSAVPARVRIIAGRRGVRGDIVAPTDCVRRGRRHSRHAWTPTATEQTVHKRNCAWVRRFGGSGGS